MQPEQCHHHEYDQTHAALQAFEGVLAKELSVPIAHSYMQTLIHELGGANQPYEMLLAYGNVLHEQIGLEIYGPLLVGYCQWVEQMCEQIGHTGLVHMALRDGAPMLSAATVLWKDTDIVPHGVYVNRPILGIEDEISADVEGADAYVLHYLAQQGIHPNGKLVLCDSGAWGTVVKEMKQKLLPDTQFYPLFWYSHNPYIPGYLNSLLQELGHPDSVGEIVNDSLECVFPQCWERPTHTTILPSGHINVVLTPNVPLAVAWGESALNGVVKAATNYKQGISHEEELDALHAIVISSKYAQESGTWTGVLPDHTPTWSRGQEFLSAWPKDLLP
ncbi:MAG: hypothetical protein UU25_C0009G0009 [Microgenomates group bacterium GW2011_GWB1_40_9]|nr:MAG: hypothetical protein UU25_C0009G0009 [Microgenomates group bacterium GW2011_GWB1_40_9]